MKREALFFFLLFSCMHQIFGQSALPVIRSNVKTISYANGAERFNSNWTISPELKPDIYVAHVKGKSSIVSFITDIDSISFNVVAGKTYDFIILLNGKDSAYTQIRGKPFVEKAIFSDGYKKSHSNKTFVEVPEVYDLVNVAFAITPTGLKDPYVVYKNSDYYRDVIAGFSKYKDHPFVHIADSMLKIGRYSTLKMDAYAFEFNKAGRIMKSSVYNSIANDDNTLEPFILELEDFARVSGYRDFFSRHKTLYNDQIKYYRDTLNTEAMRSWLGRHFPASSYQSFKIIFSPLVAYNQSATWFDNNGFKEMQAHVNFPYPQDFTKWSDAAAKVMRGNIVFTEINHSFINPEADKPIYAARIDEIFSDLSEWEEKGKPAQGYSSAYSCFNEYMNWVLVSLRYVDVAPKEEMEELIALNGKNMKERRGFTRFPEFNQYVVGLYRARKPGQTIADLYPQILDWCSRQ